MSGPLPKIKGVLAPVVTPFSPDLEPDIDKFIEHCKWLIGNNVSLAIFGTNSEATSLSLQERIKLLEALLEAGIDPRRLMPGTGCCSLPETVELTRHAIEAGSSGVLMLPPFYYKGVSDDGLFRYFSEVIERVDHPDLRLYLYHFPAVSQIPLSTGLIERLLKRYPTIVAGIKDSSGDWESMRAYIDNFGREGFDVFSGMETHLLNVLRAGGAGCISATANVNPAQLSRVYRHWEDNDIQAENANMVEIRQIFQRYPLLPAMKKFIAINRNDPDWAILRPPLQPLSDAEYQKLAQELKQADFALQP